jgi:zinc transport system substrate-binding protein
VGLALLGAACSSNRPSDGSSPGALSIVAAFYPVQEAAEHVGGDLVDVTNLTAAGAEPHDLELTPRAIEAIQSADVVLYLGDGFQPAVQDAIADAEGSTVDLLAGFRLASPPSDAEQELAVDPHVWLDPPLYAQMVDAVEQGLAQADPGNAGMFRRNADGFIRRIEALNADYERGLSHCGSTTIVTNHAAFGYLAREYGLTQEAISGLAPDAEPSARRLTELNDLVQREGVTTIFTEELVSPRVAETLADEAGVQTKVLFTLEGLTPEEVAAGDDYDSLMRDNLATLEAALDCG